MVKLVWRRTGLNLKRSAQGVQNTVREKEINLDHDYM
jgi:hypothetical protein